MGLSLIWHIPSISIEFGFHYYNGLFSGILGFLLPPNEVAKILMSHKTIEGSELEQVLKQREKLIKKPWVGKAFLCNWFERSCFFCGGKVYSELARISFSERFERYQNIWLKIK